MPAYTPQVGQKSLSHALPQAVPSSHFWHIDELKMSTWMHSVFVDAVLVVVIVTVVSDVNVTVVAESEVTVPVWDVPEAVVTVSVVVTDVMVYVSLLTQKPHDSSHVCACSQVGQRAVSQKPSAAISGHVTQQSGYFAHVVSVTVSVPVPV
jgi:hypothetical protein